MRIESLSLCNLNALRGRWHIDFNALADSGIFAITGPTGAGKTTLLDAICLALYGQTPRLGKITASQNALMTRHSGECSAEVVFIVGAKRYRVYWGQKRARGKADGKLQAPRHEIADADSGDILEDKASRTVLHVEALTGLDFARFTRAVLLAQGQFAAFLHASGDERAPILEHITGTDIYSRLSIAAHARYSEEMRILQALQGSSASLTPPDADTLALLQQSLQAAEKQVAESKAARDASLARYHQQSRYVAQQTLCAELSAQWTQVQAQWAALDGVRHALALHQRAQPGALPYRDWQREQHAAHTLNGQYAHSVTREQALKAALAQAQQQAEAATQHWQQAQHAEQQAQPLLQQARELDSACRHLRERADEWQTQAQTLAFADADTLQALAAQHSDGAALDAAYRQLLDGQSAEDWQQALDRARVRHGALRELLQWQGESQRQAQEIAAQRSHLAALHAQWQQGEQAAEQARQALHHAQEKTADKRRVYEQALVIRSFAAHRAHLQDHAPCPLCGATEHPYVHGQALPDDDESALRAAEAAQRQAEAALQQAHAMSVHSGRDVSHAQHLLAQAEKALAAQNARLHEGLQTWQVANEALPQALADSETAGKALAERLRALHEVQQQREQAAQY